MSDESVTREKGCDENCETCPSAQQCSQSKALSRKVTIDMKHIILVLSGKVGVGKSTVSVNLAFALANHDRKVGLLDLDFHGPNIPKMLGIEDRRAAVLGRGIEPIHVTGKPCGHVDGIPATGHQYTGGLAGGDEDECNQGSS